MSNMIKKTRLESNSSVTGCFNKRKNCVCFFVFALLSVLVMVTVFFFSHQTAAQSSLLSDGLSGAILDKLDPVESQQKEINYIILKNFIRKFAHFFLFTLLGIFLAGAAVNFNTQKRFAKFITIALIGLFYAVFDELHQSFIDGRSSEALDVVLDFFGVLVGVFFTLLMFKIIQNTAKKRKKI